VTRPTSGSSGIVGEQVAARFIERKGATVRARRVRADGGEIDLVVSDASTVAAVEVKTTTDGSDPLNAIDDRKVALLGRTSASLDTPVARLDVVSVRATRDGVVLRWLKGID